MGGFKAPKRFKGKKMVLPGPGMVRARPSSAMKSRINKASTKRRRSKDPFPKLRRKGEIIEESRKRNPDRPLSGDQAERIRKVERKRRLQFLVKQK